MGARAEGQKGTSQQAAGHTFEPSTADCAKSSTSQTHRIVGVGRDLERSSSPTPLLKQVPYNRSHR